MRWFLAGAGACLVLGGMVLFVTRSQGASPTPVAAAPFAAGAAATGTPPDISSMSPRERFSRLFDRVMRSAESGDESQAATFAPMAINAYEQLDEFDADARYDAALIKLHTGDIDGATALADTILKETPGHLFGYVIRGTVARFRKDDGALKKNYTEFLAHYDAEIKADRPEYSAHRTALEDFQRAARDGEKAP